jgi:hypothetical protein
MIFQNPSDEVLRSADCLILFDTNRGGRQETVFTNGKTENSRLDSQTALIVSIPVDFKDRSAVCRWKGRIFSTRSTLSIDTIVSLR